MTAPVWTIIAVVLLMGIAGVLSTVESAVASISRARVTEMSREGVAGSGALLRVLDDRARNTNVLVLLRTVCEVSGAVLVAVLAMEFIDSDAWAIAVAIAGMTLFTYLVLGVTSRTLGRRNPYSISLASAVVLGGVSKLLGPVEKLLIWVGNVLTPGGGFRDGPFSTEVELREMVDIARERGIVEHDERRMIQSVFDLASTSARSVMVPRPEMVWIESEKHAGQATALCVRSGHSRIPVIGDGADDIVGVVYLKDLVQQTYTLTDGGRGVPVTDVMRPATFVPDSKPLDDLLDEMQRDRNHIAVLVDEYGGVAGLISIEDILEEIVGEIADEYDEGERAPIEPLGDGRYRVVARLSLGELVELYDEAEGLAVRFDDGVEDDVDTVSGLIAYGLGRVPLPGAEVVAGGLRLTAEGARDRRGRMRVHTVVVAPEQPRPADAGAGHDQEEN
ncbi:hemolysin family protein [uncultured Corynebacterium sp.]|uniref:hemolysin family protein n=1 Tax=uncultured Corynebacterium sp. TaxID=159447 RepID=UPI0025CF2D9B|nr:hemolysin family protein [uncultured Corynebacterium sp.]